MRKDEEVKELFMMNIKHLERLFHTKATITENGIWITVEFGNLSKVKGRGYVRTLEILTRQLDRLVE